MVLRRLVSPIVLAASLGAQGLAAQHNAQLADSDLTITGHPVPAPVDSIAAWFGPPDSVRGSSHFYRGFVLIAHAGTVLQAEHHGRGTPTARGLRIGDSKARLIALYGAAVSPGGDVALWRAATPTDDRGLFVGVDADTVFTIWLGRAVAIEE